MRSSCPECGFIFPRKGPELIVLSKTRIGNATCLVCPHCHSKLVQKPRLGLAILACINLICVGIVATVNLGYASVSKELLMAVFAVIMTVSVAKLILFIKQPDIYEVMKPRSDS